MKKKLNRGKICCIRFVVQNEIITLTYLFGTKKMFLPFTRQSPRFDLNTFSYHTVSDKGFYLSFSISWTELIIIIRNAADTLLEQLLCSGSENKLLLSSFIFTSNCLQLGLIKLGFDSEYVNKTLNHFYGGVTELSQNSP